MSALFGFSVDGAEKLIWLAETRDTVRDGERERDREGWGKERWGETDRQTDRTSKIHACSQN